MAGANGELALVDHVVQLTDEPGVGAFCDVELARDFTRVTRAVLRAEQTENAAFLWK